MKVLIDEQLPVKLKYRFIELDYHVNTVRDLGWLGKKNGELLQLMVSNNIEVLITNDKSLYFQQRIEGYGVFVVNVTTKTNDYDDVMDVFDEIGIHLDDIAQQLKTGHEKHHYYRIVSKNSR